MLSAILIHAMMSLDIPSKVLETTMKIFRAFLWKGHRDIKGAHCLVVWHMVSSRKIYGGGLGLPNLRLPNLALYCRWAWLQWVDPTNAWVGFNIQVPRLSLAMFGVVNCTVLGNDERARC
jgi:hypothetical protein